MDKYVRKLQLIELSILDEIDRVCRKNKIDYFICGGTLLGSIRHKGFIPWDDDIDILMTRKNYRKFTSACKKDLNDKYFIDCYQTNKKCCFPYIKIKEKNTLYVERKNASCYDDKSCIWVDIFPLDAVWAPLDKKQLRHNKIFSYVTTLITIKNGSNFYQNSAVKKKIYGFILKFVPMKLLVYVLDKAIASVDEDKADYFTSFCSSYGIFKETYEKDKLFPYNEMEFEGKKYMGISGYDYLLKKIYGDYMKLPPIEKRVNHKPYIVKFPDGEELHFD